MKYEDTSLTKMNNKQSFNLLSKNLSSVSDYVNL